MRLPGVIKVFGINLGLILICILLVWGAGEVWRRFSAPGLSLGYVPHPTRDWAPAPDLDLTHVLPPNWGGGSHPVRIRTDGQGRRIWGEAAPAPDALQVAVLGDSFVFGAEIREAFLMTAVLEEELAGRLERPVRVLNLGVPGYDGRRMRLRLEEVLESMPVDLLVVALYPGNDLQETLGLLERRLDPATGAVRGTLRYTVVNGELVPGAAGAEPGRPGAGRGVKAWLRTHSRFYLWVVESLRRSESLTGLMRKTGLMAAPGVRVLPESQREAVLWGGLGMASQLRDVPPAMEMAWAAYLAELEIMVKRAQGAGVPLVFVHVPSKVQVVPASRRDELARLGLDADALDPGQPGRRLAAWAAGRNVPLLDLLTPMSAAADPAALYFTGDGHWTEAGQEFAARFVAPSLAGEIRAAEVAEPGLPPAGPAQPLR